MNSKPNSLESWTRRSFLVLLVLLSLLAVSQAATIIIDDQDQRIRYSPRSSWQNISGGLYVDVGGSHMIASDFGSYAEVNVSCMYVSIIASLLQ